MGDTMAQEQITLPIGYTIRATFGDRYVIEGLLGMGGFGAVYLVRERHSKERLFALKEVIDSKRHNRERFIFEAEILKRLNHRALPHVYQMFEDGKTKRLYMLMDYIEGQNLENLRREQPEKRLSLPSVLCLMAPIVDALTYLHHQNPPIIHRDIKPENIIVPTKSNEAVLVDFGIAKEYVEDRTTTAIRQGSPGYAALEQYGSGTTPRTDIYGLAATIYTLLTGIIPPDAIIRASGSKGYDPLEPANLIAPDIPWAIAMAIERAMSISSNDRFATVEEFWQELKIHSTWQHEDVSGKSTLNHAQSVALPAQAHARMTIGTPTPQQKQPLPPSRKYRPPLLIVLFLLLIAAIGTISYSLVYDHLTSTPQKTITAPTIAQSTELPAAISPTPTYPLLNPSYAGTVVDLLAKEKTIMTLTHIQQNQGSIQGDFQGLGYVGPFKGSITPTGHLQFTIVVRSGASTLSFEGDIKVGGDIAGSFEVLLHEGQPTGETGIWNIASTP